MILKGINWGTLLSFILVAFIGYYIMSADDRLSSYLFLLSFFFVFFFYILGVKKNIVSPSYNRIVIASILICLFNVTVSGIGNFDYYKKVIMYSMTLMWISYGSSLKVTRNTILCSFIPILTLNILYLFFFSTGFSLYDGEALLTLNFTNPNLAGMFIMNSILYVVIFAVGLKDLIHKRWLMIVAASFAIILIGRVLSLLLMTGCRSALMSVILFALLVIYDFYKKGKLKLKKWMFVFVALLPIIFVFIYLAYIGSVDFDVSFGHEDSGKGAGTRIKIWKPIVENIFSYFFFGDYYGISNGTGSSQMHNTHLDVFASYGFIPLVLYISLLSKTMWSTWIQASNRFKRCSLYAFISCQLSYMFEAGFVSGSAGMYILTVGFLIFANYNNNEIASSK